MKEHHHILKIQLYITMQRIFYIPRHHHQFNLSLTFTLHKKFQQLILFVHKIYLIDNNPDFWNILKGIIDFLFQVRIKNKLISRTSIHCHSGYIIFCSTLKIILCIAFRNIYVSKYFLKILEQSSEYNSGFMICTNIIGNHIRKI